MILVTGGAGYIGSHCALQLLEKGYETVIFDNLSTGHLQAVETLEKYGKLHFVKGDLLNFEDISKVFKDYSIDYVIHFAAFSQVGESVINPQKYYFNNIIGTLNLLKAMIENDVKKIVFSSTAAIYGNPTYIPIDERHPQMPINTYGQTKLMIERVLDDYDKAYGLKSVRLRYFNVIGADINSRIGEWHEIETHLVPNILKSILNTDKIFKIFGQDYPTDDGTCIRDYINVEDLAKAHLLAVEYLKNGGQSDYFNLGTNKGFSVKEIFSSVTAITGKQIKTEIAPKREGDPAILVADNKKAKDILGWTPEKDIKYSINTAYEWEKTLNNKLH